MALTLTQVELSAAIRLGDSTEEVAEATRLLAFTTEAISRHLGAAYEDAPAVIVNEAAIRFAGYLFDQPNAGRGVSFANAGRNSGAWTILLPYRLHRAGSTSEAIEAAQQAMGTPGNPVTGVTIDAGDLVVTLADGSITRQALPGMGGSEDQTARDAAAQAQSTADGATTAAAAAQADLDAHKGTPHNHDTTARDAAAAAQGTADAAQADLDTHEASTHNTDTTARTAAAAAAATAATAQTTASTARDAAATAQGTADGAQTAATANADLLAPPTLAEAMKGTATTIRGWSAVLIRAAARAVRPERDEVVDVENGRLPGSPVAMRLGWSQTRTFTALDFDRPTPPIGGSVSGMSSGLAIPPFPPALDTDASLFLGIWLAGDPGIAELPSGFAVADKSALTVDGTPGHYFASAMRFSTNLAGDVLKAHLVGPRLLTADDLPGGRVTLYRDSSDYSRTTRSTVFRQIPLDRAPARGRGLELVIANTTRRWKSSLAVGSADDWLDLNVLTANQLGGSVSGAALEVANVISVKSISFGENSTDSFGHGIIYVGRINDARIGVGFSQTRGVGETFRMTVREIP